MIFRETHLFFPTVPHKDIKQTVACVDFLCGAFHSGDPPQSSKRDLSPQLHPEGTQRRRGLGSWRPRCSRENPAGPKARGPCPPSRWSRGAASAPPAAGKGRERARRGHGAAGPGHRLRMDPHAAQKLRSALRTEPCFQLPLNH